VMTYSSLIKQIEIVNNNLNQEKDGETC
jgi:hypothetical protein